MAAYDYWNAADGTRRRFYRRTTPVTWFSDGSLKGEAYRILKRSPKNDPRFGWAHRAIKRELEWLEFTVPKMNPDSLVFGAQAEEALRSFQASRNIIRDGVAGPQTCGELFLPRIRVMEIKYRIPGQLLCKKLKLESGLDPACTGPPGTGVDRGIAQINSHWHPGVSDEQAYSPPFAIEYAAKMFRSALDRFGDPDVALVSYNVGWAYAAEFQQAGKPRTGGRLIRVAGKQYPLYVWCWMYIDAVKSRRC
jgi:hypothetical protein